MKGIYITESRTEKEVIFDDMQYQLLDTCDHTATYECRGYDERGNTYSGIVDKCCDEYGAIQDIELLVHARSTEKKPYQARVLLKSIRYWKSVVSGVEQPKRPLAYYKNKLAWYTDGDISMLEKIANGKV